MGASREPPEYLEEWHDRIGRDCDLPAERAVTNRSIHPPRTGCAWVVSTTFWWVGENQCGCPLCSDTRGRKAKARERRYEGRREAQTWREND